MLRKVEGGKKKDLNVNKKTATGLTLKNRRAAFYKELRVRIMTNSLAYREEWVMEVMPMAWIFE